MIVKNKIIKLALMLAFGCGLASASSLLFAEEEGEAPAISDEKEEPEPPSMPPADTSSKPSLKGKSVAEKLTPKVEVLPVDDKKGAEVLPAGKELVKATR